MATDEMHAKYAVNFFSCDSNLGISGKMQSIIFTCYSEHFSIKKFNFDCRNISFRCRRRFSVHHLILVFDISAVNIMCAHVNRLNDISHTNDHIEADSVFRVFCFFFFAYMVLGAYISSAAENSPCNLISFRYPHPIRLHKHEHLVYHRRCGQLLNI